MKGLVTRKEFIVPEAINFGNGKRLKSVSSLKLLMRPESTTATLSTVVSDPGSGALARRPDPQSPWSPQSKVRALSRPLTLE